MIQKKILILSRTFYPKNTPRSFRTTELAKEFVKQGNEVTVLLPQNSRSSEMLDFAEKHNIILKFYGPLKWKSFGKSKIIGDWKRKIGRILFLLFEYPNIEIYFKLPKYLKNIEEKYDLLVSIAVPHENHWAVAKVQAKNKIASTWIADCGDPFVGNKLESIRAPFYFKYLENSFLKHADYISVPTEGSIVAYNSVYKEKFRVIPQGFDFDGVKIDEYEQNPSKTIFAYAGGVSQTGIRSPHKFVEYLLTKKEIDFEFHIFSNQISNIKELASISKGKVILHQGIPREVLLKELSKMDFLVNLDNGIGTATPSKIIDYSLAKRPILNISPLNPQKEIIDQFLERNYTNQLKLDNIERFNIVNVARQFLNLIK